MRAELLGDMREEGGSLLKKQALLVETARPCGFMAEDGWSGAATGPPWACLAASPLVFSPLDSGAPAHP